MGIVKNGKQKKVKAVHFCCLLLSCEIGVITCSPVANSSTNQEIITQLKTRPNNSFRMGAGHQKDQARVQSWELSDPSPILQRREGLEMELMTHHGARAHTSIKNPRVRAPESFQVREHMEALGAGHLRRRQVPTSSQASLPPDAHRTLCHSLRIDG